MKQSDFGAVADTFDPVIDQFGQRPWQHLPIDGPGVVDRSREFDCVEGVSEADGRVDNTLKPFCRASSGADSHSVVLPMPGFALEHQC